MDRQVAKKSVTDKGSVRKDARGQLLKMRGRWYARPNLGGGRRPAFVITWAESEEQARERAELLGTVARRLRTTGDASHLDVAPKILERLAEATDPKRVAELLATVDRLVAGEVRVAGVTRASLATFGTVANAWTRGELAERFPHHLKAKRSAKDDANRLTRNILPFVGDVPIASFTLDDAERVMVALSPDLAPATRRQVACIIARVLKLAVFPLRLRDASPIPPGWLPRVGTQKKQAMLSPTEGDRFVASSAPLPVRIFVGFLAREGMRREEAERLTWGDVDLSAGLVRLDVNKTDDPRSWALRPGVVRALAAWRKVSPCSGDRDPIFVTNEGRPLRLRADDFRATLAAAGLARAELLEGSATTTPTGIKALRALFVTEALARGESETWVSDRTGHKSSQMIATYKRRARSWAEARLAQLGELDAVLGWGETRGEVAHEVAAAEGSSTLDERGKPMFPAVGHEGLEPSANGLRVRCSTN
jgi:integrase